MEEKVYHGVSIQHDENSVPIDEYIRQLVKEEVAAQLSPLLQTSTEVIRPLANLEELNIGIGELQHIQSYSITGSAWSETSSNNVTWDSAKESDWDKIRSIVKEEIAALGERPIKLDGKKVSEALTEYMKEVRIARGEHPDPFHIPGQPE